MAEKNTLARPYAQAVFALAHETKALDKWSEMLRLAAMVAGDKQMAALIDNPRIPRERLAGLFLDILGPNLDKDGGNLIRLLIANRRSALLPEIAQLFEQLKAEAEKVVEVEIISAHPVSAEQIKKISAALKKRLGRAVHAVPKTDPAIIGGMIIRADDLVIDGSVTGRLRALSSYLNH
ncbi:MAG TPA: F0F1 ATP synthase subunit delta [Acidiferrobacterales bacterium]|nr:F0F1 ATP synthase subunit delta [Acidiferrobacterales bacterium]